MVVLSVLKITKLQITNYIKVVGVCLPAAKEQKFIIIYNIDIIYNNKNIYIINYYFIHYKTIIFSPIRHHTKSLMVLNVICNL